MLTAESLYLPPASGDFFRFGHLRDIASDHRLAEVLADFCENGCILIVSHCLDNRCCASSWITALEDAGTDEHAIHAKLHHQCCICRSGNPTGGKIDYGHASKFLG